MNGYPGVCTRGVTVESKYEMAVLSDNHDQ